MSGQQEEEEKFKAAVLINPEEGLKMVETMPIVRGYNLETALKPGETHVENVLKSFSTIGFQATNFGLACDEVNRMISRKGCKIFLGYTSNMISSGVRETIKYLVKNKMVDVIVTTAGGIEEDFIKTMAPTRVGDFGAYPGPELRKKGVNRIGNLLIHNDNYCKFENFLMPILDKMLDEQEKKKTIWSPSSMIRLMGLEINNEDSVYYWAAKNNIPVFSPAITDGSIGDMIYFHSISRPGLILDIVEDIREINKKASFASSTGMIILGGGLIKHHICNANLMRNGADYSVFINTGNEFDGSDSGARPDEALSWGKIKIDAKPVKIYTEATLVFPLLVAQTFAVNKRPSEE